MFFIEIHLLANKIHPNLYMHNVHVNLQYTSLSTQHNISYSKRPSSSVILAAPFEVIMKQDDTIVGLTLA